MLHLLFIALPIVIALYTYLLGRYRTLVLWAAVLTLLLEGYLCANLPLGQTVHLPGAVFSLNAWDRILLYVLLVLTGSVMLVAQWLHQGELPIPIGLFILGVTNAIILLDDPIVIALLLQVAGLAIVLGTVDRPHEPIGLLPVPALMAGLKYLTMMVLAGILLLPGLLMVGFFAEMPQLVTYAKLALALIVIGVGLATAVVPFHLWFPDLAGHTTTAVTAFLVSLVHGGTLILIGRVLSRYPDLLAVNPRGGLWLTGGAVAAAIAAALLAIGQDRWKRLAAYAASYDIAVILYALGQNSAVGFRTAFLLTIHHALAMVLMLACIGVLEWSTKRDDVAGLVGVGYRMPLVSLGLVVAALSLAGIPPFGGFVGRWELYLQALAQGWIYLAGLFAATALFLLAFVRALWPIVLPTERTVEVQRPPWPALLVIGVLMLGLLLLGLYSHPLGAVLLEMPVGAGTP